MFRSISLVFLTATANLPAFSQIPEVRNVKEITLFYIPWEILTRADLSVEQVRNHPHFRVSVKTKQSIREILNALPTAQFSKFTQPSADLRLVIDLLLVSGQTITFCSDGEALYTADLKEYCKPDPKFFKILDIKSDTQFR